MDRPGLHPDSQLPWQGVPLPSVRTLGFLYAAAGAGAGAISLYFGQSQNFHVFADASRALVHGEDLYVVRYVDYFKYSPTFALLFLPFAYIPAWLGATLWSLVNFTVAFAGMRAVLPGDRDRRLALVMALAGIVLSTDGDQSNLLVGGAVLLALDAFERGRVAAAAALVAGAGFVKLFPFAAAIFALFSPRRWRAITYVALATIMMAVLPVLVCGPRVLWSEYASWRHLLGWDRGNHGWSVMGAVQDTWGWPWPNAYMQVAAAIVQGVPLAVARRRASETAWRRTFACSLLCFFVLFNHRAEYASFVLSAMATAIWWATSPASRAKTVLTVLVLFAPGPFFAWPDPRVMGAFSFVAAHRIFHPLRVLPLFLAWLWMMRDLSQRLGIEEAPAHVRPGVSDAHAR